jgi:hypothetical protein
VSEQRRTTRPSTLAGARRAELSSLVRVRAHLVGGRVDRAQPQFVSNAATAVDDCVRSCQHLQLGVAAVDSSTSHLSIRGLHCCNLQVNFHHTVAYLSGWLSVDCVESTDCPTRPKLRNLRSDAGLRGEAPPASASSHLPAVASVWSRSPLVLLSSSSSSPSSSSSSSTSSQSPLRLSCSVRSTARLAAAAARACVSASDRGLSKMHRVRGLPG